MPRYLCSSCHEVVEIAGTGRFDWCPACGAPLTAEHRLPVRLVAKPELKRPAARPAAPISRPRR
jgi:hypothetical protein